ncbi:hypothetical protein RJ640_009267 [Escallonia rubra]|uniref:Delta(3)-Delta(2)-enoyl-CoA isomerase n=1 Tax=Escallonia rubra TaxID=112253 RepID=A0AA88UCP1_9ASTE|nr:hypothetical protein RJ640_009267 [Escallonia rubra]
MCTLEKRGNIYVLTLTGTDDHRLNPPLLDSLQSALRRLRSETAGGGGPCALITTAHGNYFSNGFDLDWAGSNEDRLLLMSTKLRSLVKDLISLPMPTVAAVSGHASAAGFVLALCHDYVLMRKDRGYLYVSELDIGLVIPAWFGTFLRCKIGSPAVWRDVVMRAEKMTAEVAVQKGVIESAHGSAAETVRAAVALGEQLVGRKWDGHVYGENRKVVFAGVLDALGVGDCEEHVNAISRLLKAKNVASRL